MKLAVVEVGGCPTLISQLCEKACSKQLPRLWHPIEAEDKEEELPCMIGYYLKPLGEAGGQ
ncbi:MAG: hypothetical protein GX349_03160 [Firmicutes bacterium]|nr:hypothetical protein [Bacillota bacterium]